MIATKQRWGLFKRAAKVNNKTPARRIMSKCFTPTKCTSPGRPRLTIYTLLVEDLKLIGRPMKKKHEFKSIIKALKREGENNNVIAQAINYIHVVPALVLYILYIVLYIAASTTGQSVICMDSGLLLLSL
jgi:hypothetical protein